MQATQQKINWAHRINEMRKGLLILMLLGLALASHAASPVRVLAADSSQSEAALLTRAVFADDRLWVLSQAGHLSSIAETEKTWTHENIWGVYDLCVQRGHVIVIAGRGKRASTWVLRRLDEGKWTDIATVQSQGEKVLALGCDANSLLILTKHRLISIENSKADFVTLSGDLFFGWYSIYAITDQVLVGINAGEWGGGLRRIDRRTGAITVIGPIGDPVNGIVSLPWKPECVAIAIGLVHGYSHGRLDEVCGGTLQRLFYKPYGTQPSNEAVHSGNEPWSTVAFFGLARKGHNVWAVGIDGVYNIGPNGVAQISLLPRFTEIEGIKVSFELPQLVLVQTDINMERSLSGSVPILVPR